MGKIRFTLLILAGLFIVLSAIAFADFVPSGLLEIHYVNVGWGTSVLVIGPDGTRMLMDGGRANEGIGRVIPYMESLNIMPSDGLNYILASHLHTDHINGLTEVMNNGYDVSTAVYYNGSDNYNSYIQAFYTAASHTTAGPAQAIPLGTIIQLGDSATATCVCVNGTVIGYGFVGGSRNDENDRSVGMLIKYGRFEYLFCGDLGGGADDFACTGRSTQQVDVETHLAQAIMPGGQFPLLTSDGVEVLHVNHHGSESSTNANYMNLMTPKIACIATGSGQSPDYMFPRHDVVDNVLLSNVYCVTADPAIVLQSEEGYPAGNLTSYSGYCVGDISIRTSGVSTYTLDADGDVTEGPDERAAVGLPLTFPFDGVPPDSIAPEVHVTAPNGGEQWMAGTIHDITWMATDSFGVAGYAIDYSTDGGGNWMEIVGQQGGNPMTYAWQLPQTPSTNCLVKVSCVDYANNTGIDISDAPFTIIASPDSASPVVQVLVPNGGEIWFQGQTDTIRWNATDDIGVTAYSIGYSTNNGGTWNIIQARTVGNPQVYPWLVPNINATNCKVRVTCWDAVQNSTTDISDAPFTIHFPDSAGPSVNVIIPNGGEVWAVGSAHYVFWSAGDTSGVDSLSLQYSTDSGANWTVIQTYVDNNPGLYLWSVPEMVSRQGLFRVVAADELGNIGSDVSNAVFTVRESPTTKRFYRVTPVAR